MTVSPSAQKVGQVVSDALKAWGLGAQVDAGQGQSIPESLLEKPKDPKQGDLALPCFRFAKALGKPPAAVAQQIGDALTEAALASAGVNKAQAAGPYLNFFLDRVSLAQTVLPALRDGSWLAPRQGAGKEKTMIEYSQPNTHKAFHVGHLRNAALGDSIRRLLQWSGHTVVPVNYIGDEGAHVAKALWHLRTQYLAAGKTMPTEHLGEFLGDQYSRGTEMLSLDSYTAAPLPGIRAALIKSVEPHPKVDFTDAKGKTPLKNWSVVMLECPFGELHTVVTGAQGASPGQLAAYAPVGARLEKKTLYAVDKGGVMSEGMLLSCKELGLSEDNNSVAVIPSAGLGSKVEVNIGDEVVEIFRYTPGEANPHAVPLDKPVLPVFLERKEQCSQILQSIESGAGEIYEQWKETKEWSMAEFHSIYNWLDAHFDDWFFESEYGESSKALVRQFMPPFVDSEGAVGADLSKWKLGFCLLIKSDGTALYATRDLALAQKKFEKYGIEKSLYVVDDAQTLHFQQVFKCLELMGYDQAKSCKHLAYAQVVLSDGKMSSRKGNVVLFSQLKRSLGEQIDELYLSKLREADPAYWTDEMCAEARHKISLASMRYGMLNQDMGGQIIFDLDSWTKAEGNSGPYLLYAYARTHNILAKLKEHLMKQIEAGEAGMQAQLDQVVKLFETDVASCSAAGLSALAYSELKHELEHELIGMLHDYPTLLEACAKAGTPVDVCRFAYGLSKTFAQWFQTKECSVLRSEPPLQLARMALVQAVGVLLKHALSLIGVQTLDRM